MVLLTLIASMAIVLFLVSKKINIGYSLMTGSIILALLNGKGLVYILGVFFRTLTDSTTLTLASTILLVTILGYLMDQYKLLDRMISALERMLRSAKFTILMAPALIGTLLVTGGALMSCPVVKNLGERLQISKDRQAAINLIFRHALYFIFPLSPTIILASEVGNFNVWDFIRLQFPISIAMYVLGYFFYLRRHKEVRVERIDPSNYLRSIVDFSLYASPILVSLLGAVIFDIPFYMTLVLGIIVSILIHRFDQKKDKKYVLNESILKTIFKGIKPSMVIAVIGIMIYKNVVNDMDALYAQLNDLLARGIPVEFLILVSAAMISFPLASVQPSIAILFPMILPLAPDEATKLLYAMFIYTSAFMFYYISPLHLCQVLTLEFFEVKIKSLYKNYVYILPLTYVVMVVLYIMHLM